VRVVVSASVQRKEAGAFCNPSVKLFVWWGMVTATPDLTRHE